MKRDNNTSSHGYLSPPSPNVTFNANNSRITQRQSLQLDQFLPNPRSYEFQHRYSNNIEVSQPNNAFAHLRNQISNLRSQFTKLIQKDSGNIGEKHRQDKSNISIIKKEDRITAHSTIGFYGQLETKAQTKHESNQNKNKFSMHDHKNSNQPHQSQKKGKKDEISAQSNKYHKKYSFQVHQKRQESPSIQIIDSKKIQQLQVEIRKLGQIKYKVEQENGHLKKQITRLQKDLGLNIHNLQTENQKLKNGIQQAQISISLKNSLVQKLQNEQQNYKKTIQNYKNEHSQLLLQIQLIKKDNETKILSYKNQIQKLRIRYDQQIQSLQNIHKININELIQKLKKCYENQKIIQLQLLLKQDQYKKLNQLKLSLENKNQEIISTSQIYFNKINTLQLQINQLNQQVLSTNKKYQQSLHKNEIADNQRIKIIEDENNDLKKRVQSYKKTVQQLNNSNNSSRQKLILAKEESKKLRQQVKFLSEQLGVKQKLITSLYRDINILDCQIRHNNQIKSILSSNLKYVDDLNLKIIELQCDRLNKKYEYY